MKNLKTALIFSAIGCMALIAGFNAPKADKWMYTIQNNLQSDIGVKELNLGKLVGNNLVKASKSFTSKEYNSNLSIKAGRIELVITSTNNDADTLGVVFIAPNLTGYYYGEKCKIAGGKKAPTTLKGVSQYRVIISPPETGTIKMSKPKGKTIEISEQ